MKTITYQVPGTMARYNPETDAVEEIDCPCTVGPLPYTAENLALARAQGIGEPIIADDGQPEPEPEPDEEDTALEMLADIEYRVCMLELGGEIE